MRLTMVYRGASIWVGPALHGGEAGPYSHAASTTRARITGTVAAIPDGVNLRPFHETGRYFQSSNRVHRIIAD